MANPTCLPATLVTSSGGVANGNADNIPLNQFLRVSYSLTPGGPYVNNGLNEPGTNTLDQPASVFAGAAPGTTIYYVTQELDTDGSTVLAQSTECSFTTTAAPVDGFVPMPCTDCGGGTGGVDPPAQDVEQMLLCDVTADGEVVGTALMVTAYNDSTGLPTGPPSPVDPATGDPYVAQGTLQPCPGEVGCQSPVQFCFTTTTTGPVDHPGRTYDLTLPINPGFAVDSLQIDATSYPANLTWAVTDADGEQFRVALQAFLAARFPDQTVTVTNPNAGTPVCGIAIPMTIHIECARIDGTVPAPDLVELIYNGGRDLVVNPAYLTTPPTNLNGPQFVYMQRQDAGGTLNCTSVANTGWETNDLGPNNTRDFELWGQGPGGLQTISGTTPTPRGTPVQEITADINDTGAGPTIWQTFVIPAAGTVRVVLVHGARDNGETHRITLSTGDDNDNQTGDIINNVTNPPQVTNAGGGTPGPWTTFQQDVALGAGTYTFAISTTNPVGNNRGGLFTDMRVIVDSPDQHAAALTDDETCVVTTEETVTTTTCEYWAPRCINGDIVSWKNVADGEELLNAAFWGQVPQPQCCAVSGDSGGGGGSVTAGNLTNNYTVCAVVGGIAQTAERVVITDQSGGLIGQTFVGADGGPITPDSYTIGTCGDPNRDTEIVELCDVLPGGAVVPFIRVEIYNAQTGAFIDSRDEDGNGNPYAPTGTVTTCAVVDTEQEILCDDNGPFLRVYTRAGGLPVAVNELQLDGVTPYVPVGAVVNCGATGTTALGDVCYTLNALPEIVRQGFQTVDGAGNPVLYDLSGNIVADGTYTIVICPEITQQSHILCDEGNANHQFLRWYVDSPITGQAQTQWNFELDGETPYVPVGPVGQCEECCPIVVGDGCYNAGSGRYTAIRQTTGTIDLIDSVTGAAVAAVDIIACPEDAPQTLTSQHRLIGDADAPWTPGADVVGTLTSVTYTVLSGTATVTDEDGTAAAGLPPGLTATWYAEDGNTLTGPQSIDAVGGQVYVVWTQR